MTPDYEFAIGRAIARVRRSWTQGAYSRHPDGRAMRTGYGLHSPTVDICGALYQSANELDFTFAETDALRDFVTSFLPFPYCHDKVFGLEHFNDAEGRTALEVIAVLKQAKEGAWVASQLHSRSAWNVA